jgi:uncharacterized hydantoinase/oxoprolinase family protein
MLDVYLVLGWVAEDPTDSGTANGRPATIDCARDRLARAVCCDRTELTASELQGMAEFLAECQIEQLGSALDSFQVGHDKNVMTAIISGEGEFLARRVLERHRSMAGGDIISLGGTLSPAVAEAACAFAVAVLAAERE